MNKNEQGDKGLYDIDYEQGDFLSRILKNWKKPSRTKSARKKEVVEVDALSELATLDEKTEAIRKKTMKRVLGVAAFLSIGMFIIVGLVKTWMVLSNAEERPQVKATAKDIKLEINSFSKWQEIKDQEIKEVKGDIKNVETALNAKIETVQESISQELNATNKNIEKSIQDSQESSKQMMTSVLNEIKTEIGKTSQETKEYADTRSLTLQEKINQIESKQKTMSKNSATPALDYSKLNLPPIEELNSYAPDNTKPNDGQRKPSSGFAKAEKTKSYIEEDIGEVSIIDVSTLADKPKDTNSSIPQFTLMPGFSKGMLVTGADVPTLSQGADVSRAVWISTTGDVLVANGHTANIQECLIQAAATGNFASGIAEIRLSEITCSAVNDEGQYYKIKSSVKGWVYGENGKYGLKGRLVTKEGEIIQRAIPLTLLEAMISALETSTQKSNTYYGMPGMSSSQTATVDPAQVTGQAAAKTASSTLDKFSDYYLKILEQLNPIIEIKAGREVTIAFAGGETFKFEEYAPADVDFFDRKGAPYQ